MPYRTAGLAGPPTPSAASSGPSRRIDQPRAGYFTIRLIRKGPRVPARIRFEWGEFSAEVDGKLVGPPNQDPVRAEGVMRIWHYGIEIEQAEYDRLVRRPNPPDPRQVISLNTRPALY